MQMQTCTIPYRVRRQWACSILMVLLIAVCTSASLNRWYYWNQHANDHVQTSCRATFYADTIVNVTSVITIEATNCTSYWIYPDKLGNEHAVCAISNDVYNGTFKCYYNAANYNSVTLQWQGPYQLDTWTKVFYTCMTFLMLSFALVILLFIYWNLQHKRNLREQILANSAWDDAKLVEMQIMTGTGTGAMATQEMYDSRHVNFVQTPYTSATSTDYTRSLVSRRDVQDSSSSISEQDGETNHIIDHDDSIDLDNDNNPPLASFLSRTNPDYAMDPDVRVV